jgi:hypothetical protein
MRSHKEDIVELLESKNSKGFFEIVYLECLKSNVSSFALLIDEDNETDRSWNVDDFSKRYKVMAVEVEGNKTCRVDDEFRKKIIDIVCKHRKSLVQCTLGVNAREDEIINREIGWKFVSKDNEGLLKAICEKEGLDLAEQKEIARKTVVFYSVVKPDIAYDKVYQEEIGAFKTVITEVENNKVLAVFSILLASLSLSHQVIPEEFEWVKNVQSFFSVVLFLGCTVYIWRVIRIKRFLCDLISLFAKGRDKICEYIVYHGSKTGKQP